MNTNSTKNDDETIYPFTDDENELIERLIETGIYNPTAQNTSISEPKPENKPSSCQLFHIKPITDSDAYALMFATTIIILLFTPMLIHEIDMLLFPLCGICICIAAAITVTKLVTMCFTNTSNRQERTDTMDWKINDKFKISGIITLDTHCPRVKTTGTITKIIGSKKAQAILANVDGNENVEAIIKLRDIKPLN